jgi:uncharacterized protein (TIGR00251 family)
MLLYVKIKPGQRFDRVEKVADGWQIRLKAPPIEGKANEHLVEFLSEILNISRSKIVLIKGHTARFKTLEIAMDEAAVLAKLHEQSIV